jgi:hypothetical protein
MLRLLPRLRNTRFRGGGLRDGRTGREGVLSLEQRRCDETNQDHPTQQSPHENDWLPGNENPHGRTSGDEERLAIIAIILRHLPVNIALLQRLSELGDPAPDHDAMHSVRDSYSPDSRFFQDAFVATSKRTISLLFCEPLSSAS